MPHRFHGLTCRHTKKQTSKYDNIIRTLENSYIDSNRCKRLAHAYRMQIPSASVTSSYCTSTLIGDQELRTHQRRVKTMFKSTLFLDDQSSTRLVGHPQRGSHQGSGHSPRYPQAIQRLCHLTNDVQAWPRPRCGKFWQGVYRVSWGQRGYRGEWERGGCS